MPGQTYFSQYGNIVLIKNMVIYMAIKGGWWSGRLKRSEKLEDPTGEM